MGDIEAAVRQWPAAQEVVVIAREETNSEPMITAFVIPDNLNSPTVRNLLRMEQRGDLAGQKLFELPNGMQIVHRNRSETEFVYREMFEEQSYFRHGIHLRAGDCVFDVGANIGLFALHAAQQCERPQIYAFEPIPPLCDILRLNLAIHDVAVEVFCCGLGSLNDKVTFQYYPHVTIFSGRFADAAEERETVRKYLQTLQEDSDVSAAEDQVDELLDERLVSEPYDCPVWTLSHVIREQDIRQIDLLKIDVEKGELDVLLGVDEEHWCLIRQVVIEVHDTDGKLNLIRTLLEMHGFQLTVEQDCVLENTGIYNLYARRINGIGDAIQESNDRQTNGIQRIVSKRQYVDQLRSFLRERLPDYLLPGAIVLLDAFPLTPSGKVDRKALVAWGKVQSTRHEVIAPRSQFEETLKAIWTEVLRTEEIGVFDNFFDQGGHSLLATQVIARVRDAFQIDLPLRAIFERPTIAGLSTAILEYLINQNSSGQTVEALLSGTVLE